MASVITRIVLVGVMLMPLMPHAQTPLPPHVKADGAEQPVIYSEQTGSQGPTAPQLIKACKQTCPSTVSAHPCRIEGNPDLDAEFIARNWRAPNAVTRYSETWVLANDPADICTLKLNLRRNLSITTFDGKVSTLITIDLDRAEGTRTVLPGPGPLKLDPAKGMWALTTTGYTSAGTARYAGYSCRVLRKSQGDLEQDACLLDDPNAPASVLGMPTHLMPLAQSTRNASIPGHRIYSETRLIKFDATAPAGVFDPPPNVRFNSAPRKK